MTQEPEVPGSIPGPATYFSFSFRCFKKGSYQFLAKVFVNQLGGLSLSRNNVLRSSDRSDITLAV